MVNPQAWTGWWRVSWMTLPVLRAGLNAPPYLRAPSYLLHLHPQGWADVGGQESQSLQPLEVPRARGPGV